MTEEEFVGADSTGCQYYSLHVILTMLLVRISVFAVFSRPDPVQKHHGMTVWGNYGMTTFHVILTMLLVRIPVPREKRDRR
ncbi:MAG: hypothetical protein GX457_17810 [Thermotogaceae bacterium]|nr:hypothetical protein [Thermotogaceae bacterium]